MIHIKKEQNKNGTHNNQIGQTENIKGYVLVPQNLEQKAMQYLPYVNLDFDANGELIDITENTEVKPDPLIKGKEKALQRIDGHCSAAIQSGVVVEGKRYSLSVPLGQINLSVAIAQADSGQTDIPFSAVGEKKPAHYTPEQIKTIGKAANEWGLVNTTYYSYLKDWIERETDVGILNGIEYGSQLPDDLMQELAKSLAGFGIDVTKYAAMLGGGQE